MTNSRQDLANKSYFEIKPVSGWVTSLDGRTLPPTFTDMKDGMVHISFAAKYGSQMDALVSYDKLEDILKASLQDKTDYLQRDKYERVS